MYLRGYKLHKCCYKVGNIFRAQQLAAILLFSLNLLADLEYYDITPSKEAYVMVKYCIDRPATIVTLVKKRLVL